MSQRILCPFTQRNNPLFITFAAHQQVTQIKLQVFQFYGDDLGHAQRRRIQNFQHGVIARSQSSRVLPLGGRLRAAQHGFHFVARQRLGQHLPLLG